MLSHFYQKARHQLEDLNVSSLNRYGALLIGALLLLALAADSLSLLSTLNYQPTINSPASFASSAERSDYQASRITNSHLFGRTSADYQANSANLPVTRMQLVLRGAFTSSNPSQASAIIEGPDGQTRAYKSGSQIYGQAKLRQVFSDRVVLSRNGQLETLYFPEPGSASNSANEIVLPDDARQLVQDTMTAEEIQATSKQLKSSAMTPQQRQELIRKRLQELRNRSKTNKQ
ncbi:type II secretion system protein N [Oceanicoccus sagamiensis]|uniref:Type II secretion system protein GspC N-terminal domain-containing protein n=1 Tax=Oceanicoccus sagamiensis TaxID=716816 RepID=A0A1X9NGS1_9GAMM|nr:type II secretion system protein N [Oceanicoccus sagamiensis]ARN75592.1 hypothetical protein BST96_16655 [Oceanicoccus sagamiensis]